MKRLLLIGFALVSACATTPEVAPKDDGKPVAETPEIPYTPKTETAPEPTAEVIKPAAGGQVPGAEAAPAAAPAFDASTQSRFKDGVSALASGNTAQAEAAFKDVLSRNDRAAYAWTNLGVVEERKGDLGAAERNYRRAIEIDPAQETAWDYLARLQGRQRKFSQLDSELRAAIAKNPGAIAPRNALVYTLLAQNKLEPAASEAKKVLKADERNVRAMQLLAQVYFKESKTELARLVLENARTIDANDAATHNALGLVLLQLKQRPQAL